MDETYPWKWELTDDQFSVSEESGGRWRIHQVDTGRVLQGARPARHPYSFLLVSVVDANLLNPQTCDQY